VQDLEAVGLDIQEGFVSGKIFRDGIFRRQIKTHGGVCFNFPN
jgi:hypothetical protein